MPEALALGAPSAREGLPLLKGQLAPSPLVSAFLNISSVNLRTVLLHFVLGEIAVLVHIHTVEYGVLVSGLDCRCAERKCKRKGSPGFFLHQMAPLACVYGRRAPATADVGAEIGRVTCAAEEQEFAALPLNPALESSAASGFRLFGGHATRL